MSDSIAQQSPLPLHTAIHILSTAHRDVLDDLAFGDSEVGWYLGEELIADGYFTYKRNRSSVCFTKATLEKMGYTSGTFSGDEADKLKYLGSIQGYMRNDEQGNGYPIE